MKKLGVALLVCVSICTMSLAFVPVSASAQSSQDIRGAAYVELLKVSLLQAQSPIFRYEYTPIGTSRIQVDVAQGSLDAAGNFVESGRYRFTFAADTATMAKLTQVQEALKNRLTGLSL